MNTRACPHCSKPMIPGTLCAEWCHGLSFRPHSVTPQDEHSPRDFETFYVCKSLFRRNLHLTSYCCKACGVFVSTFSPDDTLTAVFQ